MKTEQSHAASDDETDLQAQEPPVPDESRKPKSGWFAKARHALAVFFVQTFRPRTREDYTELLLRGYKGHKEGIRNKYPWMYIRFLGLCLVLFAITACVYYLTDNSLGAPQLVLFGAGMGCIAFLILIYELYTGNEMPFLLLLAICVIGGFISVCITQFGYLAYVPDGDYAEPFWVGFWEELCKALIAILCVLIFAKKKDPFAAFLIGVAIGCGFALSEDAGYIYVYSNWLLKVSSASELTLERACMAVCTHATWTGIICWAFANFRKPFINLRFWGCVALCMLLHALWDLPYTGWVNVIVTILCVIAGIWFEAWIIYRCKKPTLAISPGDTEEVQLSINLETGLIGGKTKDSGYYSRAGNLAGSLCIVGASLMMCLYFMLNPFTLRTKTITYTDVDQFILEAQYGHTIDVDMNRPYDDTVSYSDNYSYTVTDGKLEAAIQRIPAVMDGEVQEDAWIWYTYYFDTSDGTYAVQTESTDSDDSSEDPETEDPETEDPDATDSDAKDPADGTDTDPDEGQDSTGEEGTDTDPGEGTDTDTEGSTDEGEEPSDDNTEEEPVPVTPYSVGFELDGVTYRFRSIGDKAVVVLDFDYSTWGTNDDGTEVYLTVEDTNIIYKVGGIALLTIAACALAGGIISFAVCKAKSRRMKKNAQ
ncbi:MAG: PrsW family glutamic-type intramembrane protease [Clostridia bacterium]|nr:PrsW family glutamic-type intramembrane protease [Clostridia bacterium]